MTAEDIAEKHLPPIVARLLARLGSTLTIPSSTIAAGRGEFGVRIDDGHIRRVDVVGGRWDGETPRTVAVECKSSLWAAYDALGQAVQYQAYFDAVYIATPKNLDADRGIFTALVELGLGHIEVDVTGDTAFVTVEPAQRFRSRYSPHRAPHAATRIAVGLVALEDAGAGGLRFGFSQHGLGAWFAQEIVQHLQWHAWSSDSSYLAGPDSIGGGINVERIDDVRRICRGLKVPTAMLEFRSNMSSLPLGYEAEVEHRPNQTTHGKPSEFPIRAPAASLDPKDLLAALEGFPKGFHPRLAIGAKLPCDTRSTPGRTDLQNWFSGLRRDLQQTMDGLQSLYDD